MDDEITVLLIDDNPNDRALVERELRREFPRRRLTEITDAAALDQALAGPPPDIAITDFHLRWTDGLAILRRLKAVWPEVPVIMFTGTGSEEVAVEAMKDGLDDYILKSPKHFIRLSAAVKGCLEKARQQRQRRAAEARLARLFDGAPIGLYRIDPKGRILEINQAVVDLVGFPDRESVMACNAADFYVLPEDRRRWGKMMAEKRMVRGLELQLRRFDGSAVWVNNCVQAVRDEAGRVVFYEGSLEDMSARRQAEVERDRLFNHSIDMLCVAGFDGYFRQVNPAWRKTLGWSDEELLSQPFNDFVHPEDRESTAAALSRLTVGEPVYAFENRYRCRDGGYRWVSWDSFPLLEDKLIFAVVRDVTEHKKALETFRNLVMGAPIAIYIVQQGRFKSVNPWFKVISGYGYHDVIDMKPLDIVDPAYRDKVRAQAVAMLKGTLDQPYEYRVMAKDGEFKWVLERVTSIDYEGQRATLGFCMDITAHKQAEAALEESEARYRNIFDNAAEGIFQTTPDGRFISANRALAQMFGYASPEDMVAQVTDTSKFYVEPGARQKFVQTLVEQGAVQGYEVQYYRRDGSKFWASLNARTVRDAQGEMLYFEGFVEDIDARKQAEEKLLREKQFSETAMESLPGLFYVFDQRGNFLRWNSNFKEVSGYGDEEIARMKPEDFFTGQDKAHIQARVQEVFLTGAAFAEAAFTAKDGRQTPCYFTGRNVVLGEVPCLIGMGIDISARKQAEAALEASYTRLRRALDGTVSALGTATELRDPYTAGHQRRVTRLACALAQELGFDPERIEGLRIAGFLHDLGKIAVPAEILSKPGKLTNFEFHFIMAHPQTGYDIVKEVEFGWPVAQAILQHHERMDGSGYPQGLTAKDIIDEAKILMVADVVEAMASHRPYRPTLGLGAALEEVARHRGVRYDAEVVDACQRLFAEKRFSFSA
jgi:PAS domain S-box-containing protein